MDGEFLCEATTGMTKEAVGGGNLLLLADSSAKALAAAEAAVAAIDKVAGRDHAVSRAASCARARRSAANTRA